MFMLSFMFFVCAFMNEYCSASSYTPVNLLIAAGMSTTNESESVFLCVTLHTIMLGEDCQVQKHLKLLVFSQRATYG